MQTERLEEIIEFFKLDNAGQLAQVIAKASKEEEGRASWADAELGSYSQLEVA